MRAQEEQRWYSSPFPVQGDCFGELSKVNSNSLSSFQHRLRNVATTVRRSSTKPSSGAPLLNCHRLFWAVNRVSRPSAELLCWRSLLRELLWAADWLVLFRFLRNPPKRRAVFAKSRLFIGIVSNCHWVRVLNPFKPLVSVYYCCPLHTEWMGIYAHAHKISKVYKQEVTW